MRSKSNGGSGGDRPSYITAGSTSKTGRTQEKGGGALTSDHLYRSKSIFDINYTHITISNGAPRPNSEDSFAKVRRILLLLATPTPLPHLAAIS